MRPLVLGAQRVRERERAAELGLHDVLRVERGRLGRREIASRKRSTSPSPATCSKRPAGPVAQRGAAGVGADAVDRGLDDDLEHRVAVEALGERLADAPDRLAQPRALELELLEPLLELARHRVELGAERGELVVALGRDLDPEVAAGHAPGGVEQALDLGLQRARDRDRERERRDQRGGEDRDDLERGAAEAAVLALGEQAHLDAPAVEAGPVEAGDAQRAAADLDLAPARAGARRRRRGAWRRPGRRRR